MPIYAFRCDACGHAFDRLQKLTDADPEVCPACRESAVKRQVTAPSFRLAGSGWYETDFKKDGDKKRNLADKGDAPAKADAEKSSGDKASTGGSDSAKSSTASGGAKSASSKDSGAGKTPTSGTGASSAAN